MCEHDWSMTTETPEMVVLPVARPGRLAQTRERAESHAVTLTAAFLICLGVGLRLDRFLHYRSLWLDEATLALNLMSRSYGQLFHALAFDQGAPAGFLVLEKLAISLFGDGERAFRLFPFLAGAASVVVFWRVALRFLDRRAALLALAFFAVMEPFVYYSAETRPYSFDVLAALVLVWLFDRAVSSEALWPSVAFAAAGIVAPWFSFGSLFVLAGTGVAALVVAAVRRRRRPALLVGGAIAAWLVSFALEYLVLIRHLHHLASNISGINAQSSSVVKNLYVLFNEPGASPRTLDGIMVFLTAVGALALARSAWPRLLALAGTLAAAMLVGLAHRYPVDGRWVLYLLALAVLVLGAGCVALVRATAMPVRLVVVLAIAALLGALGWQSARNAVHLPSAFAGTPATLQPTRFLLGRVADAWRPGDVLYVSVKSQYAFRYYLTCHDCNSRRAQEARLWPFGLTTGPSQTSPAIVPRRPSLVLGSSGDDLDAVLRDFQRLRGHARVWFLFTHTAPLDEGTLELWLDHEGRQLQAIRAGAASALLYDLR
jgi:hypothetical protein